MAFLRRIPHLTGPVAIANGTLMETTMTTAVLRKWMPKKTIRTTTILAGLILTSVIVNAIIILADGKGGIQAY